MPFTSNWKKPFEAALGMVADSKAATLKLCTEQILRLARTDSIIQGGTKTIQKRNGGTFLLYVETPEANRYSRPGKRWKKAKKVFHETKFFSRKGNLEKALAPAGGWSGNKLNTRGEGEAEITVNENKSFALIRFKGEAEGALKGGDSKKGRGNAKVEITDSEGKLLAVQNERGRRRPIELASRKVARQFEKIMKAELEKKTRSIA